MAGVCGLVEVKRTADQGMGLFATADVKRGSVCLTERALQFVACWGDAGEYGGLSLYCAHCGVTLGGASDVRCNTAVRAVASVLTCGITRSSVEVEPWCEVRAAARRDA